jgi:hypothetical protein
MMSEQTFHAFSNVQLMRMARLPVINWYQIKYVIRCMHANGNFKRTENKKIECRCFFDARRNLQLVEASEA